MKNCELAFDRIGAFQHNFPKATIFDSGVCEINARTKKRDKQPQSPPAHHVNVGCLARPHGVYKNGRLFRTRTDPPQGRKHNIEMRGTGVVSNCARTCAGVYFANTGLEKEGLRYA